MTTWRQVTKDNPCPGCGRGDWCRRSADGAVVCHRGPFDNAKELLDRNGVPFWMSWPGGESKPAPAYEPETGPEPAPPEQRDRVYRELLGRLGLSQRHKTELRARGFTPEEIGLLGVKSLDRFARREAPHLAELFPYWQSVPGLYCNEKGRPALGGHTGLIIPVKDLKGLTVALRVRLDNPGPDDPKYSWVSSARHGGASPGSPPSWWPGPGTGPSDTVRICEGELKSAFAAARTGVSTICAPGVGLFGSKPVLEWLKELAPRRVLLAPDADFRSNQHVDRAVQSAAKRLAATGYEVAIETWDPSTKGLDDAIQGGLAVSEISPEEFFKMTTQPEEGPASKEILLSGVSGQKAQQILQAICQANNPLIAFVNKPTNCLSDLRDGFEIEPVSTPESLAHLCENRLGLEFYAMNKDGEEKRIDAPDKALKRILGMPARDLGLPIIAEFIDFPVLSADGTLIQEPGLHPSGAYYRESVKVNPVPTNPSPELVAKCLDRLDGLICDFPFEEPEDRQAFYSYLFTGFVAEMAPRPWPLWNFSAPTAGSGKGLLANLPGNIAEGKDVGAISIDCADRSDAEMRKVLTGMLASGMGRWKILDNVKGHLSSSSLEAFLTATVWTDRLLGSSRMGSWIIRTGLALTANNLTLSQDLERRQVLIRLCPDTDKPSERLPEEFSIPNLVEHIHENRAELLWCVLVLVQRWVALGSPQGRYRLGSFERWSAAIGGLLDCVGIGSDFLKSKRVSSVPLDPWPAFVESWTSSNISRSRQPASELVRFCAAAEINLEERHPAMSLGRKLNKQRGRVFRVGPDDAPLWFRLDSENVHNHAVWSLEPVNKKTKKISESQNEAKKSPKSPKCDNGAISENGKVPLEVPKVPLF